MAISKTLRHAKLVHTFQPAEDSDAILTQFTSGTETAFNSLTITNNFNVANAKTTVIGDLIVSNSSNTLTLNAPTINIGRDTGVTQTINIGQDSDDKTIVENGTYDLQGRVHLREIADLGNDSDTPKFLSNFTGVSGSSITLRDMALGPYDIIVASSITTRDSDLTLTDSLTVNGTTTLTGALNGNDSEFTFSGNISGGSTGTFTGDVSVGGSINTANFTASDSDISVGATLSAKSFTSTGNITGTTFTINDSELVVTKAEGVYALQINGGTTADYWEMDPVVGLASFTNTLTISDSDLTITNFLTTNAATGTTAITGNLTTVDLTVDSESTLSLGSPSIVNLTVDSDLTLTNGADISAVNATHNTSLTSTTGSFYGLSVDSDISTGTFTVTSSGGDSIQTSGGITALGTISGSRLHTASGGLTASAGTVSAATISATTINATSGTAQGATLSTSNGVDIGTTLTTGPGNLTLGDSDLSVGGLLQINNDMTISGSVVSKSLDITGTASMTNLTLTDSDATADSEISTTGTFAATNAVMTGTVTVGTTLTQEATSGINKAAFGVSSGTLDINASFVLTGDISSTSVTSSGNIAGVNLILSADSDATLKCSAMSGFGTLAATDSTAAAATNTFTGLTVNGDATKDLAVTGNISAASNNADMSGNLTVSGNQFEFDGTNYTQVDNLPIQSVAGTTLATFRFLST